MAKNFTVESSSFIPRIKADFDRSLLLVGGFFLLTLFLKIGLKIPLPKELFLLLLFILFLASLLMFFSRKFSEKEPEKIIVFHFGYGIFQMILLTVVIYYTGGITWITPVFYSFTIINAFWIYPRNLAILMLSWCSTLLVSLTILQ